MNTGHSNLQNMFKNIRYNQKCEFITNIITWMDANSSSFVI